MRRRSGASPPRRKAAAGQSPAWRRPSSPARAKKVSAMPDFVPPQLCASVEKPPSGAAWCHEIKFDGYRVQLRVEDGEVALNTRKGLDWAEKFPAIAKEGRSLPDAL